MKNENNSGSVTLEAAVVVPIFIILMLLANGLFILFMGQQVMAHTLVQSAKSLAFDPYASQRVDQNAEDQLADMFVDIFSFSGGGHISTEPWYQDRLDELDEIVGERYAAYLRAGRPDASALLEKIGVKDGLDGLDFSGCSLDTESGILTIRLRYTQEFVFNAAGLASFDREISVKVKLFEYHP